MCIDVYWTIKNKRGRSSQVIISSKILSFLTMFVLLKSRYLFICLPNVSTSTLLDFILVTFLFSMFCEAIFITYTKTTWLYIQLTADRLDVMLFKDRYLTLLYLIPTLWIWFSWHDEVFNFSHQPHEHNLLIICIVVYMFASK